MNVNQQSHGQTRGDADLLKAAIGGDMAAFDALVDRYHQKVYRLALRFCRNREDAEEVTQDVFLSAFRRGDTFDGRSSFGTWLYRIAANAALMKLRGRASEARLREEFLPEFDADGRHLRPISPWSRTPEEILMAEEGRGLVRRAIAELPPDYRAVVLLHDLEGLPHQEVAEILGTTTSAIKARSRRARLVLRGALSRHFGTSASDAGPPLPSET